MPNQDIRNDTPRGGHELPPEAQDRPEQNRGYDEAAHGERDEDRLEDPIADEDARGDEQGQDET